jgi:hypothetical protein
MLLIANLDWTLDGIFAVILGGLNRRNIAETD